MLVRLLILVLISMPAYAEYEPPSLPCIPTVSDYDTYYRVEAKLFAVVWWCNLDDGLYTRWWTANVGSGPSLPEVLRLAGRDPESFAEQAYKRESTPAELELVKAIELAHAPRCYVQASGATTAVLTSTAQHTISVAKRDASGTTIAIKAGQQVACLSRLPKEPDKAYCEVRGSIDTKSRLIEGDAWVACQMRKAPIEGWQ